MTERLGNGRRQTEMSWPQCIRKHVRPLREPQEGIRRALRIVENGRKFAAPQLWCQMSGERVDETGLIDLDHGEAALLTPPWMSVASACACATVTLSAGL